MKNLFVLIILLFSGFITCANYDFNQNCINAYSAVTSLKFEKGQKLIKLEKKINPRNDIPYYIESYIDFLKVVIGERQTDFIKLKNNNKTRISKLENGDKSSPYYNYCLAEIYLQTAFARIKFKEYLPSAFEVNKAYRLLEKNHDLYPEFIPNYKDLGILHAMIGSIPDEYQWVTNMLNIKGSLSLGIDELNKVLRASIKNRKYEYLKDEAIYYKTFVVLFMQNEKENIIKLDNLYETPSFAKLVKRNPMLCYSKSSVAMNLGLNDKAINILLSKPKGDEYFQYDYLDYMLGEAKLNRLDSDAKIYIAKYISNFSGQNYIKSAYQKLAWCYLLNGDVNKYKTTISKVLKYGNSFFDIDKQALVEAESGEIPNIYLLKARLLFDGGYYNKSLKALVEKKPSQVYKKKKDALEFTYRLARIYHQKENISKAISYYEITFKNGKDYPYYFIANSSLQLGMIYENKSDFIKAKKYYKKCLSMNPEKYKNGIHNKAKAGINRIENK